MRWHGLVRGKHDVKMLVGVEALKCIRQLMPGGDRFNIAAHAWRAIENKHDIRAAILQLQ